MTVSKSISGSGLPMSLVLLRPEVDVWKPGAHTGTFRGNNLAFVSARVALETYWADSGFTDGVAASRSCCAPSSGGSPPSTPTSASSCAAEA